MERYRVEQQPQSHNCLANVGSGPGKYQLQQLRPSASFGIDTIPKKFSGERQYSKYDGLNNDGASGVSANIYRQREQGAIEKRDDSLNGPIESAFDHRHSKQQQQQQRQRHTTQWQQYGTTATNQRDQSHSPSGRRYHFGGGGRGGRGGGADTVSTSTEGGDTCSPYGAIDYGGGATTSSRNIKSSIHDTARSSVRERECVAPEEKPILRSEHKRHSR